MNKAKQILIAQKKSEAIKLLDVLDRLQTELAEIGANMDARRVAAIMDKLSAWVSLGRE